MSYKLRGITHACTHNAYKHTTTQGEGEGRAEGECVTQKGRLYVWVERCPMCLGALDRFHAPISNETHRPRHTHTHTHTNSMLGILSAQLPASDEKSMARGERRRDRRTKISKREICYNMPSLMVAGECSNSSYKTSFECFWLKKGFLRQH